MPPEHGIPQGEEAPGRRVGYPLDRALEVIAAMPHMRDTFSLAWGKGELPMKTAASISSLADQLETQAGRLVAQESMRADAIARVKENKRLSDFAKKEELSKVTGLEVLSALRAQVHILKADLDAASKDWANLSQVLRAAAFPGGVTPDAAAVMGLLRDEASSLESDPTALQNALESAALAKDWPRVHSLVLGRLDENGTPLSAWKGVISGLRLDCLDLPGQESVMESLYRGETAALQAEAAWSHAIGQSSLTTVALLSNAPDKLARAKFDRQARVLMTPAEALKKAEDERVSPGDRYVKLETPNAGCYTIFDTLTGDTRTVGTKEGPAYLKQLNDLTHIAPTSVLLPDPTPVEPRPTMTGAPAIPEPGTVPGRS